jgi:hypothetical protein
LKNNYTGRELCQALNVREIPRRIIGFCCVKQVVLCELQPHRSAGGHLQEVTVWGAGDVFMFREKPTQAEISVYVTVNH